MVELEQKKAVLNELIEICAKLLDIKKPVKLTIEPNHPFAEAAVRKLKNGVEVEDLSGDYNEIEIFIYAKKEWRQQLNESLNTILLLSEIIHELLHIRHPDWDEDTVADEEARITRLILDYMECYP